MFTIKNQLFFKKFPNDHIIKITCNGLRKFLLNLKVATNNRLKNSHAELKKNINCFKIYLMLNKHELKKFKNFIIFLNAFDVIKIILFDLFSFNFIKKCIIF